MTAAPISPEAPPGPQNMSLGRLVAFALPAAPVVAIDTPVSVYLPAFYASAGLSLSLVGALFLIGRMAEIPIALLAGTMSDRLGPTRRRRKFWLCVTAPFAMFAVWRLFHPPADPSGAYLMGWLLAVVLASTLLSINHLAWGAEVAAGTRERTRLQAGRQVVSTAALILVLVAPILIEHARPAGADRFKMQAIADFLLIVLPLTVAIAALLAPERLISRAALVAPSLREALAGLRANRALRRLLLVDLCDAGALGIVTSLFVFFSRDVWGLGRISSLLLLIYIASGVILLGPLLRVAGTRPKPRTIAWIAIGLAVALPTLLLAQTGGIALAVASMVLLGAPSATNTALLDSLMGDIAAQDAVDSGRLQTGLFYALHLMVGRVGRGVAIAVSYALLERIGFRPNLANTVAATGGFKLLYVGAPVLLQLSIAALMWNFPRHYLAAYAGGRVTQAASSCSIEA